MKKLFIKRFQNLLASALIASLSMTILGAMIVPAAKAATREVVCGTGTYTITDGIASAGRDCTGALVIEDDVTEIANNAFQEAQFTSLVLSSNLITIGSQSFYGARGYTSLVIPDSVTIIKSQAFEQNAFSSLVLGNGLTTIEYQAFYRNFGGRITSLTFGTGLVTIGSGAFLALGVKRLQLPEGVTTLGVGTFASSSIKTLILPNSLTSMVSTPDQGSFEGSVFDVVKYCGNAPAVTSYSFNVSPVCGSIVTFDPNLGSGTMVDQISATDTVLRTNAFTRTDHTLSGWNTQANGSGTSYAADAVFPFSTAPDTTLYATWSLPLYNSGTGNGNVLCSGSGYFRIASNAITGNSSCVGSAVVPNGITSIQGYAFQNAAVTDINIPNTITSIGPAAFRAATNLTSVTFASGSTLTSIGSAAFERTAVATIALPESLISLGNYAFWSNSALTSIVIPSKVTGILANTFENNTSLTSVTMPAGLTLIQFAAFRGATALTSIVIPSTVTSIGSQAFSNTPSATTYAFCGTVTYIVLLSAGLSTKIRGTCAPPYVAPTPIPFLRALTPPQIHLKDSSLICSAGEYQTGQTLAGQIQTNTLAAFTPTSYKFNLLINGVVQTPLAITTSNPSLTWNLSQAPRNLIMTCNVFVSFAVYESLATSTDNNTGVSAAQSSQTQSIAQANADYTAALNANSKAYQKALIDNRAQWRKEIAAIRANYLTILERIKEEATSTPASAGNTKKLITDKSTALKVMIAAQKKSAADYKASQPAAVAAREDANKAALATRDAAVAKANAAFGTFIESIGYGVLIP